MSKTQVIDCEFEGASETGQGFQNLQFSHLKEIKSKPQLIREFFAKVKKNKVVIFVGVIFLLISLILILTVSLTSSLDRISSQVTALQEYVMGLDAVVDEVSSWPSSSLDSNKNFNATLWETAGSCSRLHQSLNMTKVPYKLRSSSVKQRIYPPSSGSKGVEILCDFKTNGSGWSIIQRRSSRGPKWGFYRGWTDYEQGFGSLEDPENSDFWIGLKTIHDLTSPSPSPSTGVANQELRIELTDWDDNTAVAHYEHFSVSNSSDQYRLSIGGFFPSSTAGDSLVLANGMQFSTKDRDNDKYEGNCAAHYFSAWWFNSCMNSNLNGLFWPENEAKDVVGKNGVSWHSWRSPNYSLKRVEMKVRDSPNFPRFLR